MNLNQRLLYRRGLIIFRMLLFIICDTWWYSCDYFGNNSTRVYNCEDLCIGRTYELYKNDAKPTTPGEHYIYSFDSMKIMNDEDWTFMGMLRGYYCYAKSHYYIPFPTPAVSATFAPTPPPTKIICSCKHKKFEVRVIFSLVSTLQ